MTLSLLEFCDYKESEQCGYCKKDGKASSGAQNKSVSMGVWAHQFSSSAYLDLMNCGWRRSGCYVYKPIMEKTCCPQYTIRLDSKKFYLTGSQKRVLKRMNEFLKSGVRPKGAPIREEATQEEAVLPESKKQANETSARTKPAGDVKKKKEIRRERCFKKWAEKGLDITVMKAKRVEKENSRRSTLGSLILPGGYDNWKHQLEVVLVKPKTSLELLRRGESFELFKKYQAAIHDDPENTIESYCRFLIQTPLLDEFKEPVDEDRPSYGSYHQWYILDGKIIAVGVVDILPHCLSSKYVFYDPDYRFLNLGTYTALREIFYTQQLSEFRPELKYYYMGYYIHSCPKMRYKGKYHPSELLCDNSFKWFPLSECATKITENDGKFVQFDSSRAERLSRCALKIFVNSCRFTRYSILEPTLAQRGADVADIRKTLDGIADLLTTNCDEIIFYVSKISNALPTLG